MSSMLNDPGLAFGTNVKQTGRRGAHKQSNRLHKPSAINVHKTDVQKF